MNAKQKPDRIVEGGVWLDVNKLLQDKHQPRQIFREEDIEELGESLLNQNQKQAVIVSPAKGKPGFYYIKYGESRWRACKKKGIQKILCIIDHEDEYDGKLSVARVLGQTVENVRRTGHTHSELVRVMSLILKEEVAIKEWGSRDRAVSRFAKALGKSIAWANSYKTLTNLHPDLLKMIDAKGSGVTFLMGVELATNDQDQQKIILEEAIRMNTTGSTSMLHRAISTISRRHKIASGKRVRIREGERREAYFAFFKKLNGSVIHLVGSLSEEEFSNLERSHLSFGLGGKAPLVLSQVEKAIEFLELRSQALKAFIDNQDKK